VPNQLPYCKGAPFIWFQFMPVVDSIRNTFKSKTQVKQQAYYVLTIFVLHTVLSKTSSFCTLISSAHEDEPPITNEDEEDCPSDKSQDANCWLPQVIW
jgi:hypothetical protein